MILHSIVYVLLLVLLRRGGESHPCSAGSWDNIFSGIVFMFIYHLFICYLSFVLFILLLGLLLRRGYGFAGFDQGFI